MPIVIIPACLAALREADTSSSIMQFSGGTPSVFCGIEIYVGVLFTFAENGGGAYRFKHSPQSCVMKHGSVKLGGL